MKKEHKKGMNSIIYLEGLNKLMNIKNPQTKQFNTKTPQKEYLSHLLILLSYGLFLNTNTSSILSLICFDHYIPTNINPIIFFVK